MRFRLFVFAALVLCLGQVGCAFSPQQVTIRPELTVAVANYGSDQELNVRAEDERQSTVIGTRGGVYGDTSTIEIGNDHKTEIAYAIANAFSRWGFKTRVNGNNPDATQVRVVLTELTYTPDSNPALGKVHIKAAVALDVKQGGAAYHGNYEATGEMGYVTAPSEEKNNKQINQILGLALQKIFEDKGLIKFLQQ